MAEVRLTLRTRNALCDALRELIDAAGHGAIELYVGAQPREAGATPPGKRAGTLAFARPSAPSAQGGTSSAAALARASSAEAAGRITWARIKDGAGNALFDCDVSALGDGGTIELVDVNVVEGQPIELTAFTWTIPKG